MAPMRVVTRAILLAILSGMVFGAIALPFILHSWILIETDRDDIALAVAVVVFMAFAVSLGVIVGVANFLRRYKKESPAQVQRLKREILDVELSATEPVQDKILRD